MTFIEQAVQEHTKNMTALAASQAKDEYIIILQNIILALYEISKDREDAYQEYLSDDDLNTLTGALKAAQARKNS